jgi:hypothetical protein
MPYAQPTPYQPQPTPYAQPTPYQPQPTPYQPQPTPYQPQPTPYAQPDDYSARYAPAFSSAASSGGSSDHDFDALTVRLQKLNSTVGE